MRLVFFGTPDFAVPALEALLAGPHDVVAVVSQPDRPRGRGRKRSPSPIAQVALDREISLLRPERVAEPEVAEALRAYAPDLGIVVAFGQFLPKRIRELPSLGYLVNAHASLLPRHRGAAPIAHAILAGDAETGVCAMRVEREMDTGAVCGVRTTPIGASETTGELTDRLAALAAELIAETVGCAAGGQLDAEAAWAAQDHERATLAPRIEREHARLDFSGAAVSLARRVRAMAPKPGSFARWDDQILRILGADVDPRAATDAPGTLRVSDDGTPRIATGEGWLVPTRLQRPGGRALDAADFQRGHGFADGDRLGTAD